MFFIFDMQEEWTWNISNNYIIKSDINMKLKYIRIYINIYLTMQNQINLSTMKTHLTSGSI